MIMMYYAIMDLSGNDFGPVNTEEYIYLICTMLISLMLQTLFFGDIAVIVKSFFKSMSEQQAEYDKAIESILWMNSYFPGDISEKDMDNILSFLSKTAPSKEYQERFTLVMQKLTPTLQR